MAQTPEKKVKQKVTAVLKKYGVYYFYPVTGGYGASGVFDIVCCYKGFFVGIEVKADLSKKGPTTLQERNAMSAKEAGAVVFLIDANNIDVLERFLESLQDEKDAGFTAESVW